MKRPVLTIVAGPNGSGKSSITGRVHFVGRDHLLEADAIASRICGSNPQSAAVKAGREVFRRTREYLDSCDDFAIETTLSGGWTTGIIKQAQARNFIVRLIYVCLDNPERSMRRVRERVAQGGHHVPDEDVRRRYGRSLSNLERPMTIVDEVLLYDNSGIEPVQIFGVRFGIAVMRAPELPAWARVCEKVFRPESLK